MCKENLMTLQCLQNLLATIVTFDFVLHFWIPAICTIVGFIYIFIDQSHFELVSSLIQSNLAIRNFLVALKLFLNAKSFLSLWSKWQIGHGKWFLNTNLFIIKSFLIAKFDCKYVLPKATEWLSQPIFFTVKWL